MLNFARIQSIEMMNFKNVGYGFIDFSTYDKNSVNYKPNITALYGQNGSGKTALIDALSLTQTIILGKSLPSDIKKYIKAGEESCSIKISLYLKDENGTHIISYKFVLREVNNNIVVAEECIKSQDNLSGEFGNFMTIINYISDDKNFQILPQYLSKELSKDVISLFVAQSLSQRVNPDTNSPESTSFIFSSKFLEIIDKLIPESSLNTVLTKIINFANNGLMIIDDRKFGGISENVHAIPIYTKSPINNINGTGSKGIAFGCLPIEIYEKTLVPELLFPIYQNFVEQINTVLPTIIPNLTVKISSIDTKLIADGVKGVSFEISTIRDNKEIGLKYESAGIKKILCILSSLIGTYNNYDMCFVVDELDSGIFEYLLGQIIKVFKSDAKGQLIFTSHNLHVVELLDNDSLVFTRANTNDCYFHLPNVKANNNKRLLYLRNLELANDNDIIYNKTNQYEISYAFECAYDLAEEGDVSE